MFEYTLSFVSGMFFGFVVMTLYHRHVKAKVRVKLSKERELLRIQADAASATIERIINGRTINGG
jgi:uncharacterized membrane-anchored protein YhcB (DUF1043 family)